MNLLVLGVILIFSVPLGMFLAYKYLVPYKEGERGE